MQDLLQQCRTLVDLLSERIAVPKQALVLTGVLATLLVGGLLYGWMQGDPVGDQRAVADALQRVVCQACDYDNAHPLHEIRAWERDDSGWYACPQCQQFRADRHRRGGVRVITPRPAAESRTPPSDD